MYAGGVSDKPSYEEIVAKNDILHGENDVLHGEIDVLRIEVSRLTGLTETQNRKIAELERKSSRNSSNSLLVNGHAKIPTDGHGIPQFG